MKTSHLDPAIQGRTCVPLNILPACDYGAFQKEQPA
jgi:hypothetical protein